MAMSGLGGVIAGAVAKQIVSKLLVGGEYAAAEVTLQWRYREQVLEMGEKMKDIEAVLGDADERSRRGGEAGRVFQRWLTKFKRVAYDVEDVLDELDADDLISKTQSKASLWFSRNNQLLQRLTMPHKMKKVMKKIDGIEKEGKTRLNLVPQEARGEGSRNNETLAANWNAHGMETGMVGRGVEKEKIISLLLTSEEANQDISIIPVVGLGGIGKTTLAESVLADKRVSVFDVSVWVKVSKQFDLHKIGSAILKSMMNSTINLDSCDLQSQLKKELATRRYLIVLDDLWEEDGNNLERLKEMLQHGRKGSHIIVTTRNLRVVQQLRTGFLANQRKICPVHESETVELGVLQPGDCWELMKQRAFGPDDDHSGLEEIGKQIAAKCGGLPLVANALGQVMSELRTVGAWEDIRDTKVDLGLREGHQKETLERLMLSYCYMKLEFKMCFTYLAAFSKGFVMDSNRLIQQWNALGYICPGYDGQRCINYLLGMSFLRVPGSASVNPSPLHFKAPPELVMHDLVHDLASIIVADEFIDLDATKSTQRSDMKNRARYCRHAQLTNFKNDPEVFKYIPHKLRSLHFRDSEGLQLPKKAFSRSKYIRVLDLSGHSANGQSAPSSVVLPSSVKQLKLIRYLDATGLPITSLPKYFHELQNMETIILSNSLLETLPDSICRLSKLCYLDLSGSSSLSKLPASLGELSQLFFLNLSGCCILQELPESICELTCLHHLDMSDCCALQKLPDNFGSLLKLSFLNLSSCSKLTKLPDNISFPCLEHLNLSSCHELENLPIDFGHLQKLEFVNLSGCYKISMLPGSFCQLNHLKHLDLSDCHHLEELPECFDHLSELEYLNLTSCPKLRQLPESICKLFKLRCLYLSYCLSLNELPSSFGDLKLQIPHMNGLVLMSDCPDSIGDMTSLTQLVLDNPSSAMLEKARAIEKRLNLVGTVEHHVHEIESRGCSSIVDLAGLTCSELMLLGLQNVRQPEDADRVKLRDKSNIRVLKLLWENEGGKSVLDRLVPPRTLESFWLAGYMSNDFPDWMFQISSYLPFLSELALNNLQACDCLPPFGTLPNLRRLCLLKIPNIRKVGKEFYGEGGPCMKLTILVLTLMENLEEWWTTESSKEDEEFLIPNLHHLEIMDCPKLKFLPYPPRSMNWVLSNSEAVLPEQGFGNLSSSIRPSLMVLKSCSFSQHKWDGLQHLPTLEKFQVISVSGFRTLPEVMRCFTSLTELYLKSLKDLEALPVWLGDLGSLEEIGIDDCPNLTSLPESMKNLTALRKLKLNECKGLETLPGSLGQLTSLAEILIHDCPNLTSLPENMKSLTALGKLMLKDCKGLETLPGSLGQLISLEEIVIHDCPNLTSLPESMKNLTSVKKLELVKCKGMDTLPGSLGQLTSLEEILIFDCPNLTSLPESMKNLRALRNLTLIKCKGLETLPGSLGQLTSLEELLIGDCQKLTSLPESIKNLIALKILKLTECQGLEILPEWLGELTSLEEILISHYPNLTSLPESMKNLTALKSLALLVCNGLEILPEWLGQLTSLEEILLGDCNNLTSLPESMKNLTALKKLSLVKCKGLETLPASLGQLTSLEEISIGSCANLTSLPESMNLTALRKLMLTECKGLVTLPGLLGQLTSLEEILIGNCPNLISLPESMKNLTALRKLMLTECKGLETLPGSLGQLTSLEEIVITKCPNLTSFPESMKNLTALTKLRFEECKALETLPGWLGQLTSLEEIILSGYPNLTSLPESMKNLTALRRLWLRNCKGMETLPGWLGQLTSLEQLITCDCPNLISLPESIRSLSALKLLKIVRCPRLIVRCHREDAYKIRHIPTVEFW
ncbi:hypothetical protein ACQJBY_046495 [Aegilops geniculata]